MANIANRKPAARKLTAIISMRLSPDDRELLDSVSAAIPIVPTLTLARLAMRLGLEILRQDPARALMPRTAEVDRE
jgi:hypothetical protein